MQAARRRGLFVGGIMAALVLLSAGAWLLSKRPGSAGAAESSGQDRDTGETPAGRAAGARARVAQGRPEALSPEDRARLEVAEARLARAQQVLDGYRESTKYPPGSRPMREQPDQVEPHWVSPRRLPLAGADDEKGSLVILRQSHYYLAGDESVVMSVECGNEDGPLPCEILSAGAAAPDTDLSVPVQFTAGAQGTMHTATFTPAKQGFSGHHGPIHVELGVRIGNDSGGAGFDVEYTPRSPAWFTGQVHERLENGSLVLGLEMEVATPGRYVIAARVEDTRGQPFAYLSFNDMLPGGRTEATLVLFGKLVLDERAESPFRLRDVEGFLLKEDTFPDRELLPTLEGVVHTTRRYGEGDFSADEWQSEQRDRYLDELGRDVDRARDEVNALKTGR